MAGNTVLPTVSASETARSSTISAEKSCLDICKRNREALGKTFPLRALPAVRTDEDRGYSAATSDAFILTLLGVENVSVYDGSMAEWAAVPALSLVTGDVA